MTKAHQAILKAVESGYTVNESGNVVNRNGVQIKSVISDNYARFTIRLNNSHAAVKVHRLLAYQKFGSVIFNKSIHVRHLNGNSLDNSYNNIAIGSASDNMMDKSPQARHESAKHAASFIKKKKQIAQLTETE